MMRDTGALELEASPLCVTISQVNECRLLYSVQLLKDTQMIASGFDRFRGCGKILTKKLVCS